MMTHLGWLRHQHQRDNHNWVRELWNPQRQAEWLLERRAQSGLVAPREDVLGKIMRAPKLEERFPTNEVAFQALERENSGRRLGRRRSAVPEVHFPGVPNTPRSQGEVVQRWQRRRAACLGRVGTSMPPLARTF